MCHLNVENQFKVSSKAGKYTKIIYMDFSPQAHMHNLFTFLSRNSYSVQ